ncbi:MAG TPA: NADH-quinone oxidoreductase subunit N [Pyrinomonadaceae bacterium]|jgi:NADH-quinone oxidoreductase subunit N|nr:NADH-quinone oxidoreductase subunit N [Pyrinomonadaceae bacterium]
MNLSFATPAISPDINFALILPEVILSVAGVLVMLTDALTKDARRRWATGALSLLGLAASAASCLWLWDAGASMGTSAFNGMIVLDQMRLSFTLVFILIAALTILVSMVWVEWERLPAGEFHTLLLFATVGMMLMASGGDLVILFLGLETLSIATYVMAGFRKTDLRSNESSLKYFILGSFSSAFLLYGIALIYGATAKVIPAAGGGQSVLAGTTNISEIAERMNDGLYPPLLFVGAAMLLIGFGFKIATAPFHVWTPDVYEGAPTPVTAFMAAGPKAAGFAAFMRVFLFAFPFVAATTQAGRVGAQVHEAWLQALTVLAMLTMTIGNVVALVQNNVKRMLAYSSIAHAGYALVGFVAAGAASDSAQQSDAVAAVIFYLLSYAVMNLGAFAVVTLIARSGDRRTEVEDYNGIGFRSPALAFALSLFLLSLLGMPLTAGFMGKIMVFREALNRGYVALVVVGVLNTAVSVYYYLRLIVVMFFRERSTEWSAPRIPASLAVALVITAVGVLYLGIFPGRVLDAFRAGQNIAVTSLK